MQPTIQILPETLCNQIAAGEVVERPASVVKELVENSLDAGARQIRVDLEQGGRRLIRVLDDGAGMPREDAFLALERHATSKIRSAEDLFALNTLGFRGEALPSIASVSRLTLRTRTAEQDAGTELRLEGGTVRKAVETGMAVGTQIEVRQLFFNTPARRKFLRTDETELGHCADVVTKQALAHPEVAFTLSHNGRTLLEARQESSLLARVADVLGRPMIQALLPVDAEVDGLQVQGLVSHPRDHRATTGQIFCYINGRYVRDRVVQHALLDAYRTLLPRGRYPVVVLFLNLAAAEVDVNVHPTKHEVRFRRQRQVHDALTAVVREALGQATRTQVGLPPVPDTPPPAAAVPPPAQELPATASSAFVPTASRVTEPLATYHSGSPRPPMAPESASTAAPPGDTAPAPTGLFADAPAMDWRYIGQYLGTYLLAQEGSDLILIDQHAAHERLTFERFRRSLQGQGVPRQGLLYPETIDLDRRSATALETQLSFLEELGFEIAPFGGTTFAIAAIPQLLSTTDAAGLVRDLALELADYGSSAAVAAARDEILMRMACHQSVRAHQQLSDAAATQLIHDLAAVDFTAQCPHGRPVLQRLTAAEVARMFQRG